MTVEAGTRRKWGLTAAFIAGCILAVFVMIYLDVVSRAKESFLMGETYMNWVVHPEQKKTDLEEKFLSGKSLLEKRRNNKKINDAEFQRQLEVLAFDRDQALQESSLKYAYQWYKDTYELFSPPESKWVRMAREKAPIALDLWKKELSANKIPFDDNMFE